MDSGLASNNSTPDKKIKSVDIAYKAIKRSILSGELKPGENLPETEFAQKLGVSRTPLREALNHLKYDGLVVIQRYSRSYVASFDKNDIAEIHELRARLEGFAAGKAALQIDDAGIDKLRETLVDIDRVLEELGDNAEEAFSQLNTQFHCVIWKAANLPRTCNLLESSLAIPFNVMNRLENHMKEYLQRAQSYHKEIYSAIKARDSSRAEAQMRAHILSILTVDLKL